MVKVHCGSAHVKGKAKQYPYFVASLFTEYTTKKGIKKYRNSGISTTPRRSINKCIEDAQELAQEHSVSFVSGYGSLHNQPV